jgi:hypothetical protein
MRIHEDHDIIKRSVTYRRQRDGHLDLTHYDLNKICTGEDWLAIHAPHLVKAAQEKAEALKLSVTELLIAELGKVLSPSEARQREGE